MSFYGPQDRGPVPRRDGLHFDVFPFFTFRARGVPTPYCSARSTSVRGIRCKAPILIAFSSPRSTSLLIVQSETPHCSATSPKLNDVRCSMLLMFAYP